MNSFDSLQGNLAGHLAGIWWGLFIPQKAGPKKTMTATDVTGFDAIFSTGFFCYFLKILGGSSYQIAHKYWRKSKNSNRTPVETAPRNCRFLSLVVVKLVLKKKDVRTHKKAYNFPQQKSNSQLFLETEIDSQTSKPSNKYSTLRKANCNPQQKDPGIDASVSNSFDNNGNVLGPNWIFSIEAHCLWGAQRVILGGPTKTDGELGVRKAENNITWENLERPLKSTYIIAVPNQSYECAFGPLSSHPLPSFFPLFPVQALSPLFATLATPGLESPR